MLAELPIGDADLQRSSEDKVNMRCATHTEGQGCIRSEGRAMKGQRKEITKEQAASMQLDTAVKLYFENRDLVSAHTLAAAATGIIDGVYKGNRNAILQRQFEGVDDPHEVELQFPFCDQWDFRVKPQHRKEFFRLLNASQNFFKHANRDADAIHQFNDWEECGIKILTAIRDFHLVFENISRAMEVFQKIYLILHPNMLIEGSDVRNQIDDFRDSLGLGKEWEPTQEQIAFAGLQNLKSACPEMFLEPNINCIV